MNQNLTEMVFILDMSGSMCHLTSDTIGGYNSLIKQQKEEPGEANVTTVLFDNGYIMLHDRVNIKDVPEMTTSDYMPYGSTALLDAVGQTINYIGQKLAATPENERPAKVIVTIITDGYENASKEFSWGKIKEMITHQREKYNWTFTFLGANIDTMEVSNNLGIDARLSKTYTASKAGTDSVYCAVSKGLSFARSVSAQDVCLDFAENISTILDEVK